MTIAAFIEEMESRLSQRIDRMARRLGLINQHQQIKISVTCARRLYEPMVWSDGIAQEIERFSGWKTDWRCHEQADAAIFKLANAKNEPLAIPGLIATDMGDCNQYLKTIGFPYAIIRVGGKSSKYQLWRRI